MHMQSGIDFYTCEKHQLFLHYIYNVCSKFIMVFAMICTWKSWQRLSYLAIMLLEQIKINVVGTN